ncbi:hypothetical protein, partial [Dialister micraerophilus]|uniref:hypothetical protein n=1 Tax=Dialister micraerophilus TaxID=309120 RepID=UPI0023F4390D
MRRTYYPVLGFKVSVTVDLSYTRILIITYFISAEKNIFGFEVKLYISFSVYRLVAVNVECFA